MLRKCLSLLLAAITGMIAITASASEFDPSGKAALERIAKLRILFGHQSVGANILEGLRQLASASGIPLKFSEVTHADQIGPATFGDVVVAENGKPLMKLASFERALAGANAPPDIAFVKFCYVDFSANTDPKALFNEYRATMERLKAKHPNTVFVHLTAPLTEVEEGMKATLKRLVGRAPYGIVENMRRDEYNNLIRATYAGREPLFDLARIEATTTDGRTATVEWRGQAVPVLLRDYTDDGGHLNAAGRTRAARELVSVLEAAAQKVNKTQTRGAQ